MNFFQRKLKEQETVGYKVVYEGLIGYKVINYHSVDDHREKEFLSFDKAKTYAVYMAKEHKILCRLFGIYPSGDKQIFEIDKSEKYDEPMGCLSWIFLILGIAFVACSIILPVFYP